MGCNKKALMPLLGAVLVAVAGPAQAEPTAAMMANTCAGCHGTDGKSVGPASPNLAGISEAYFIESMEGFKSGERPATIMDRIAKGYTEKQVESMASVFAALPVYKAKQTTEIYEKSCSKCHDEGGALPDDDSGILAGQWLPWLQYSMEDYLAEHREMPKKMKKQVKKLDDAQLQAVLHYFASQQ